MTDPPPRPTVPVLRPDGPDALRRAAALIAAGGVLAVPTDTVYGLACHPADGAAVDRIYGIKGRPRGMELSILGDSVAQLARHGVVDPRAAVLAERFWPGPLSLVVPAAQPGRDAVPVGPTVSLRIPASPALRSLLRLTGPLATTSANRHGEMAATTWEECLDRLGADVDAVLAGPPSGGQGSTIIDLTEAPPRVLRAGPLSPEVLRPYLGDRPVDPSRRAPAAAVDITRPAPLITSSLKPALRAADPEVADLLEAELRRQEETLELIPSENLAPPAVLEALGSWLNNKYAEGYPGKRYYGGCEVVDRIESLAIDRARRLFGAEHVNVQPHCGSSANLAVYTALLQPGDRILALALDDGGHLTHGAPVNLSGKLYQVSPYGVDEATNLIDMDQVRARALEARPRMIVAGYTAYPRILDFAAFRGIADEVGALLLVDMAHFAGLVAGGAHPSPVPHADVVTFTTHKTMRGPWGGMILCREEHGAAIDRAVFPGMQGGPLNHAIAGKAVMLQACMQPQFRDYARRIVENARALAAGLTRAGVTLVTGGTDNHLMLVDLRPFGIRGKEAQLAFDEVGITLNKNAFRGHGGTPFNPNGLRLGTPTVTTRGMGPSEMDEIAAMIASMLRDIGDPGVRAGVRERSLALCRRFPLSYREAAAAG